MNASVLLKRYGGLAVLIVAVCAVCVAAQTNSRLGANGAAEPNGGESRKSYTNEAFGFSFLYPSDATSNVIGPGAVQIRVHDIEPQFAMTVDWRELSGWSPPALSVLRGPRKYLLSSKLGRLVCLYAGSSNL